MMENLSFKFTKVRKVHNPTRNNFGDAGLDFYMPEDLTPEDILQANKNAKDIIITKVEYPTIKQPYLSKLITDQETNHVTSILIGPKSRIVIPSGIRVLLEPINSMMQVNNKSGRSTKQGLIFTAQVCDSPYTGEYHIGIYNTSKVSQELRANESIVQFVHVPIFLSEPQEISNDEFFELAENWGTRGDNGMGSSNNQPK